MSTMSRSLVAAHIFAFAVVAVVLRACFDFHDAKDALAFYGVYHREPRNQIVHFFGVPGILWSILIFMVHLPVPILSKALESKLPADYQLNYGLVFACIYLIFYLHIDSFGGSLYAPILFLMYLSAVRLRKQDQAKVGGASWAGTGKLMTFAFVVHILSWYVQIHLGHKIFEGAQPAVMQSLGGVLTVAPLFAFYEGLWFAGINKNLQNETQLLVQKYTIELCDSGVDMRVCQTLSQQ